jgi:hypothetical protein
MDNCFQNLKPGDKVLYKFSSCQYLKEEVVERTTEKFLIVKGKKFRKSDGMAPGVRMSYAYSYIRKFNQTIIDEQKDRQERSSIINKLEKIRWGKFTVRELRTVEEAVNTLVEK